MEIIDSESKVNKLKSVKGERNIKKWNRPTPVRYNNNIKNVLLASRWGKSSVRGG